MNIKGTRTENNLWNAFSGESQTRNKYIYFSEVAASEGHTDVANFFQKTAVQEENHGKTILSFLNNIRDTQSNLRASIQTESYEASTMYKDFEQVAIEEGFPEIASFFKDVAKVEEEHAKKLSQLLNDISNR